MGYFTLEMVIEHIESLVLLISATLFLILTQLSLTKLAQNCMVTLSYSTTDCSPSRHSPDLLLNQCLFYLFIVCSVFLKVVKLK